MTRRNLILSLFALASMQAMAQAPTVTTDTRFARGATMAFGRATFVANGSTITERGFCWSADTKEPTVEDNVSKTTLSNNGLIYWMKDMQPATKYYARAYAKAADGSVGYGNVLKIVTLPKGTIGWGYDNAGSEAENARISSATEECVDYWNSLTSISGLYLSVHYNSGVATADCSYGGWMRVGANASYQKTGTIMHEALHAIGVGTCDIWYGSSSPLRAGSGTGLWLGDRATDLLRFWDNSSTATLTGDGTHLWPYGINGAHEDNGTQVLYIGNSLIAQAICEDGLPPTTSHAFGLPYYSFDQEDDVKYYIKSESPTYGLYSSFLVEDESHCLKWQAMTAEEAAANDAAAWYVTFTPDNQYYQLRNAATGYYMTYAASGLDGIKTVQRAAPTSAENFHLMRSRIDITTESGSIVTPQRGYWVIHPENTSATPGCLTAYEGGSVTVQGMNLSNNRQMQRWVILTAAQAADMENTGSIAARDAFAKNKAIVEELAETPHRELTAGADNALAMTLADLTAKCNASTVAADIQAYAAEVLQAGKDFLKQVMAADMDNPFDLTPLLVNPDFATSKDGWTMTAGATYNYGEVEFYQSLVSATQTVKAMPLGTYRLNVQAFQRPGASTDVYDNYVAGQNDVAVMIWLQNTQYGKAYIKNIMEDRSATMLNSGDKAMADGTYIPNTMAGAAEYIAKGLYDNEVVSYIPADGDISIYLRGTNSASNYWTLFDNFRLYYFGPLTMDELTGAPAIAEQANDKASDAIYNLSGQYMGNDVNSLPAGIYIKNHKAIRIVK